LPANDAFRVPLDIFLSRNDNSGGKTHEASEVVEYDFYFTKYDVYPV
jgi:hypothetical protein